jgi:putative hydrolase of HD superfamily
VSEDAAALAAFGYELGVLKRIRRAGWWHVGVRDPESVAEHSLRVAQLAAIIAAEQITADQTGKLPERSGEVIRAAVDEYESRQSPEALCAKDADKLEMLLQAVEYRDVGVHRVDGWIESARKGLRTETGRRIGEAAVNLSPLAWRDR